MTTPNRHGPWNKYRRGPVESYKGLQRGLIFYWPLDEGTDPQAGNGNQLRQMWTNPIVDTARAGQPYTQSNFDNNFALWGYDRRMGGFVLRNSVADAKSYLTASGGWPSSFDLVAPFTTSCWFLTKSIGAVQGVFGKHTTGAVANNSLAISAIGKFNAGFSVGGVAQTAVSSATVRTGRWYHHAMTYDGATITQYVNGAIDGTVATAGPPDTTLTRWSVGLKGASPLQINGFVSQAAVWARALGAGEIRYLAQNPFGLDIDMKKPGRLVSSGFGGGVIPVPPGVAVPRGLVEGKTVRLLGTSNSINLAQTGNYPIFTTGTPQNRAPEQKTVVEFVEITYNNGLDGVPATAQIALGDLSTIDVGPDWKQAFLATNFSINPTLRYANDQEPPYTNGVSFGVKVAVAGTGTMVVRAYGWTV